MSNNAFFCAAQTGRGVAYCEGLPGHAKTDMMKAFAKLLGRKLHLVALSQWRPEDVGGYPVVRQGASGNEVMRKVRDERLDACYHEPSLLVLDELTNCHPEQQAAALLLMSEGIPGTIIVACGNPPAFATDGHELSWATINRLGVFQWQTDWEEWERGAEAGFHWGPPPVPVLPETWTSQVYKWGPLMKAYRRVDPAAFLHKPEAGRVPEPHGSPRSWHNAAFALAACESVRLPKDERWQALAAYVGEANMVAFKAWHNNQDIPDPEAILANPSDISRLGRPDMLFVVIGAVNAAIAERTTMDRWNAGYEFLEAVYQKYPELAVVGEQTIWRHKPVGIVAERTSGLWQTAKGRRLQASAIVKS